MVSAHARRGKRLRAIVAHCAISRSHNYSAQSRDSENAQRDLEIAQILRLRRTYSVYTLESGY